MAEPEVVNLLPLTTASTLPCAGCGLGSVIVYFVISTSALMSSAPDTPSGMVNR